MTSRIISSPSAVIGLRRAQVERAITTHFQNKNDATLLAGGRLRLASQAKMTEQLLSIVFGIIDVQLEHGFRLNLNDEIISEYVGVSERRAQTLRLELKEIGIVWFPEWSRPKKKGDYPYWMVAVDFLNFEKKEKKTPKNRKYVQKYYDLRKAACKAVYADLVELDCYITMAAFMQDAYKRLDEKLEYLGLSKADLLR